MALKLFAINCTLKSGDAQSSTDVLLGEAIAEFDALDVESSAARAANFNIMPGVSADEGEGDDWPTLRKKIYAADILLIGTPIWMGQPSSVCKRILERLDAVLGEADDEGRFPTYGKVACCVIVGNEDGAHHSSAEIFQVLNDVGYAIAPNAVSYWVGEAMQGVDYKDLDETPEAVANATRMMARNTVHLARALEDRTFPSLK